MSTITPAPARTIIPCAAMAKAAASEPCTPADTRIAAPAPACATPPAGAIGSAAADADAQRNAIASGIEVPTERALSSTNTASTRKTQETATSPHAFAASFGQAVCCASQRMNLKRSTQR